MSSGICLTPPRLSEGAFYLLVRLLLEDELAFIERLAEQNIFCLPGRTCELPGYFRISSTPNDEMKEPKFITLGI